MFMWGQADFVSPKADGMLVKLQRCYVSTFFSPSAGPKHCALPSLFQENSCLLGATLCSLLPSITTLTGTQTYKVITKLWQQIHDIFLAGPKGQLLFFYQVFSFLFQLISQAKPSSCLNPDSTPPQLACAYITTAKGQISCSYGV